MSNLVGIAYPDADTAQEVAEELAKLQDEDKIAIEDLVIVTRGSDGKVKLHQNSTAASAALGGAMWGGLIGLVFLAPLLGMAIGGAAGAAGGAAVDYGVDDDFMKDLGAKLPEGGAALFVLAHRSTPGEVLPRIAGYGGEVVHSTLSSDQEKTLEHALARREA